MRMSMSTTSGARLPARPPRAPSAASPTTSMSGSASRIMRKPLRTSSWSSAMHDRIILRPGQRQADAHREPASGGGAASSSPPRSARARASRSARGRRAARARLRAGAVVDDLELDASGRSRRASARRAAAMPAHVRQRLLHDPVGGRSTPAGRARPARPRSVSSTREAGRARCRAAFEPEPGLRARRRVPVAPRRTPSSRRSSTRASRPVISIERKARRPLGIASSTPPRPACA